MRHLGAADHEFAGNKLADVAAGDTNGDATRFEETPVVDQTGTGTGRTIFVQFDGEAAPTGQVKGDILIKEVP